MVEDYTSLAKARTDSTMDDLPAIAPLLGTEPFINVFDSSLASDHGRETSARWFLFHVDLIRLGASLNLFPLLLEMLRTKGPGLTWIVSYSWLRGQCSHWRAFISRARHIPFLPSCCCIQSQYWLLKFRHSVYHSYKSSSDKQSMPPSSVACSNCGRRMRRPFTPTILTPNCFLRAPSLPRWLPRRQL